MLLLFRICFILSLFCNTFSHPEIVFEEKPNEVIALSVKQGIFRIWKRSLNERKMEYWNHLRFRNTAVTYEKWLGKENPVLPRKFRPVGITGEAEEDKDIRREMALKTLESEVKLLKNKANRGENNFKKIDLERAEVISKKATGEVKDNLLQLWKLECGKEEEKSECIWQKSQMWLDRYEDNFGNDIFIMEKTEKMGQTNEHVNTEDFEVTMNKSDGQGGNETQGWRRKRQQSHPLNQGTDQTVLIINREINKDKIREEGSLGRLLEMALRI